MERRCELRVEANEPAVVTPLGAQAQSRRPMGGLIMNLSGGGILAKVSGPIACGTPVRFETANLLLLGEVLRCEAEGAQYRIAVKVRHCLRELQELENLNCALLGSGSPVPIMGE